MGIIEKMEENRLRWYEYVEKRENDEVFKRIRVIRVDSKDDER